MILKFNNIFIYRNNNLIIKNFGLSLKSGACIILRGDNGCGKTSLLKVMAGLLPFKGNICYNDYEIDQHYQEYYSIVNYLGHRQFLSEKLSVYENLSFWASFYDTEELLSASFVNLHLLELKNTKIFELSAGFRQRVMLANLLLKRARIWLIDEPFINLDIKGQDILYNLINTKCSSGGIVILSHHGAIKDSRAQVIDLQDFN